MGFFDFVKRKKSGEIEKKEVKTPEQKININQVTLRHEIRIKNLLEEAETLSNKLIIVEEDEAISKGEKSKVSGVIIQRLTLIRYEVGIREDLISWL